jgi:uncharacterized protein YegJ (DUF2314 family)
MKKLIAVVTALLILLGGALVQGCGTSADAVVQRPGEPDVHMVNGDDPEMNAAIAKAQSTLDGFVVQLNAQKPNQRYFSVKVRLEQGDVAEHVWLDEPQISGDTVGGYLANEPLDLTGYALGQVITVTKDQLSDWMYVQDDVLQGGYTLRVLRDRMSPEERAEFDEGLNFIIR